MPACFTGRHVYDKYFRLFVNDCEDVVAFSAVYRIVRTSNADRIVTCARIDRVFAFLDKNGVTTAPGFYVVVSVATYDVHVHGAINFKVFNVDQRIATFGVSYGTCVTFFIRRKIDLENKCICIYRRQICVERIYALSTIEGISILTA